MNRSVKILMVSFFMFISIVTYSLADVGEMGFFCGISEGIKLPKVMERYVVSKNKKNKKNTMRYKEIVFVTGEPLIFEGELEVNKSGIIEDKEDSGSFTETYIVKSKKDKKDKENLIVDRQISFNVNWRRVDNQILKDYELTSWNENIKIGESTYKLNFDDSNFNNAIIEYISPGIKYYKGSIDYNAVYEKEDETVTVNVTGDNGLYGYNQAWGKTETQLLNVYVNSTKDWNLEAEVKPSITINKTMQYDVNRPDAIGFGGNYLQVIKNAGGLKYNIKVKPWNKRYSKLKGNINIPSFNTFEHLVAPANCDYLNGSFAKDDIRKLYSLEVLDNRYKFIPNEKLTRAQYITMIIKALGLDVEYTDINKDYDNIKVFYDVDKYHPHYKNIMIAYDKNIIKGTNSGKFNPDRPIDREEAFVIYMRTLGLSRLGLEPSPVISFIDDTEISTWAKKDIYALYNIGLVKGDPNGKIRPKSYISKAEGAALVNRLIDYLRIGIEKDYIEKIN